MRRGGLTSRQGAGAGEDGLLPGGDCGEERGEVVTLMAGAGGVLTSSLGGGAGQDRRGETRPRTPPRTAAAGEAAAEQS